MKTVKSLPAFVADNFKLQKNDFWQVALAETGIWVGTTLIMYLVCWLLHDSEPLSVGVPGIAVIAMSVICSFVVSLSRVWMEFTIGVQMSAPRRRMIAAGAALNLALGGMTLALAALLNALWRPLFARGLPAEDVLDLLGKIPAWGWLTAWLLPVGLGMLCGALVLRFGRRAGWVLYFAFLAICWSPTVLENQLEKNNALVRTAWDALRPVLPVLGPAAAVVSLAAAAVLLLRAAITT